jgi:hypothetical protein
MNRCRYWIVLVVYASVSIVLGTTASAASVIYTGSSGPLSAAAKFDLTGTTLTISLTNMASSAAPSNTELLTGVFWNSPTAIAGAVTSLALGGVGTGPGGVGSVIDVIGSGSTGGVGRFAYGTASDGPGDRDYGAFSAGYATLSSWVHGPGGSSPPLSPDGPGGGLVPNAGFGGSNNVTVIKNTAVWTITNVNSGFTLSDLQDVWFQYGTNLNEPGYSAVVPLPAAAWMGMSLLGGVGGVGFFRRRRLVEA